MPCGSASSENLASSPIETVNKRPNLIVFVGESHNRELIGAHGHPLIQTPSLDQLAQRGALFRGRTRSHWMAKGRPG